MDGNGRWAADRGMPRRDGHRAGAESVREVVEGCKELGIDYLTLYAFSSENWNRPKKEIDALMNLLKRFLKEKTKEMHKQNVRLHAIGRLHLLPDDCRAALDNAIASTANNTGLSLILALSYGSREEIIDAASSIAKAASRRARRPRWTAGSFAAAPSCSARSVACRRARRPRCTACTFAAALSSGSLATKARTSNASVLPPGHVAPVGTTMGCDATTLIAAHEGSKTCVYTDSRGHPTVGIGE